MKMRTLGYLTAALFLGCGGGAADGEACDDGGDCESGMCTNGVCGDGASGGGTFDCGSGDLKCSQGEYCLVSATDSVETAAECLSVPECGMDSCDCAGDDAATRSSCEGALQGSSCTSIFGNESIVVTCDRSGAGF